MKVFQTNLLLDKIIVFGSQGSDKIFNGNTRVGFPLTFQLFQLFVPAVEDFWLEQEENGRTSAAAQVQVKIRCAFMCACSY